jgi:hypothetical protein
MSYLVSNGNVQLVFPGVVLQVFSALSNLVLFQTKKGNLAFSKMRVLDERVLEESAVRILSCVTNRVYKEQSRLLGSHRE